MKLLDTSDLRIGDLIFWVNNNNGQYAGHIALVQKIDPKPKHIRIIHSTDSKKYLALCSTRLLSSYVLHPNKRYEVIRCKDIKLLSEILNLINFWVQYQPIFNQKKRELMENFENARTSSHAAYKETIDSAIEILRMRFKKEDYKKILLLYHARRHLPPLFLDNSQEGFFCSSVFVLVFQLAALAHIKNLEQRDLASVIPLEFQLDFELTSPAHLFNALLRSTRFEKVGELRIEYGSYSDQVLRHIKQMWPQEPSKPQDDITIRLSHIIGEYIEFNCLDYSQIEHQRTQLKSHADERREMFFSYTHKIPENLRCQVIFGDHPETNMIRRALKQKRIGDFFTHIFEQNPSLCKMLPQNKSFFHD